MIFIGKILNYRIFWNIFHSLGKIKNIPMLMTGKAVIVCPIDCESPCWIQSVSTSAKDTDKLIFTFGVFKMLFCIIGQILFYSFNCVLKIQGRNIPFCNYRKIKKLWFLNIFHDLNRVFSSFGFIKYRKEETIGFVYLPQHKNIKTIRSNIFLP